jgi:hypothetical protein
VFGLVTLVQLGNHEDYVQVEKFVPHPTMTGFVYHPEYGRILYANRGARWVWGGKTFVSLGGANSIDFESRTEWVSWWKQEQITLADIYNTANDGHADVMITHDCPLGVNLWPEGYSDGGWSPKALRYANESRESLRHAVNAIKPDILFHGHYHKYIDTITVLNDGVEDYTLHSVGLDMDDTNQNLGIFDLKTFSFNMINEALYKSR